MDTLKSPTKPVTVAPTPFCRKGTRALWRMHVLGNCSSGVQVKEPLGILDLVELKTPIHDINVVKKLSLRLRVQVVDHSTTTVGHLAGRTTMGLR